MVSTGLYCTRLYNICTAYVCVCSYWRSYSNTVYSAHYSNKRNAQFSAEYFLHDPLAHRVIPPYSKDSPPVPLTRQRVYEYSISRNIVSPRARCRPGSSQLSSFTVILYAQTVQVLVRVIHVPIGWDSGGLHRLLQRKYDAGDEFHRFMQIYGFHRLLQM